jgi:hypothetical protein
MHSSSADPRVDRRIAKRDHRGRSAAIGRCVERLAQSRSRLSTDLELDGYYYLLVSLVFLQGVDRIPAVLSGCAEAFRSLGDESLQNASQLRARGEIEQYIKYI